VEFIHSAFEVRMGYFLLRDERKGEQHAPLLPLMLSGQVVHGKVGHV